MQYEYDEEDEEAIAPERLKLFQTTLGKLMMGSLFENDAAEVDTILEAVNTKMANPPGGDFEKAEAIKALKAMGAKNLVM